MWKKLLLTILSAALLVQLGACGKKTGADGQESQKPVELTNVSVWSAPSTVRVEQKDIDYAERAAAELTYNAVRNEYESRQLFLTASENVENYYLEVSDLKNGDHVLSKEHIAVYMEHFAEVTEDEFYDGGYWPDALIPLDEAKEYNRLTIAKDHNAALWITVYVPKELAAGTYEGVFELSVGKEQLEVPVSVRVNDYTLTDDMTNRTMFRWIADRVAAGEMDASVEMLEYYYEFFLEYRICLGGFPVESLTGEELVDCLEKYGDVITSFLITKAAGADGQSISLYPDSLREQILALAAASSPEKNLLEKALLYTTDEPKINTVKTVEEVDGLMQRYLDTTALLEQFADEIAKDNSGVYSAFKKISNWREVITDIPNVVPYAHGDWLVKNADSPLVDRFLTNINCLCLNWDSFTEDDGKLVAIERIAEKYNLKIWWYGANLQVDPMANYHFGHSNLLSSRSISWLQAKYNIVEGTLYYLATNYTSWAGDRNEFTDTYLYPNRSEELPAGDGTLTYPGAAYGIYGPLPSMRLMSIRDGMEEYEILQDVESGYKELVSGNKNQITVNQLMEELCRGICEEASNMYCDGEYGLSFDTLRSNLISTAVMSQKGANYGVFRFEEEGDVIEFGCIVSEGAKVYIGGALTQPSADGCIYTQVPADTFDTLEISVEGTDGSRETFVYEMKVCELELNTVSEEGVLKNIQMDEAGTAKMVQTTQTVDGVGVKLNVNGVLTGDELEDVIHEPIVKFSTEILGEKYQLKDLLDVTFGLYASEEFNFTLRVYDGDKYVDIKEYEVRPGMNAIRLEVDTEAVPLLENADAIAFVFENSDDGNTVNKYEFYLDSITGTIWRGEK